MVKGCLLNRVERDRLQLHKLVHMIAEVVAMDNLLSFYTDSDLRALDRIEADAVSISRSEILDDKHSHIFKHFT